MLNDPELENLLSHGESDRVEFKETSSDKKKICQAICAFANDFARHEKPGVIFIGVKDDGAPTGLSVTDKLLKDDLGSIRSDGNILPQPNMLVEKRILKGHEVAVVIVQPSPSTPVRYKGSTWIRTGTRRGTATAEEEKQLSEKRRSGDLPFDAQIAFSAEITDLDKHFFLETYLPSAISEDILAQNNRSYEEKLSSVRFAFFDKSSPCWKPTNIGLLTVGKDPRRFIPGAYIQFLRIDGKNLYDPIKSQKEITGSLVEMIRRLDDILEANISIALEIAEHTNHTQPDYPLQALKQISRNAILHRSYDFSNSPIGIYWFSDRIEINSPGGPFGRVNKENFGQPGITDYRNPHLAETLKNLGYIERFGAGIAIAREAMRKNGNPEIEFIVDESNIVSILRKSL